MIFSVMPGNPSGIEFLHKKRCLWQGACLEMSSSAATAEKREVNASGLLVVYSRVCSHPSAITSRWHTNPGTETWFLCQIPCQVLSKKGVPGSEFKNSVWTRDTMS